MSHILAADAGSSNQTSRGAEVQIHHVFMDRIAGNAIDHEKA
jgi:hypothetical protein